MGIASSVVLTVLYSSGAAAKGRHRGRQEIKALEYPSLIATEELTKQLRPVGTVPLYHKHSVVTKATAKPLDLYQ